MGAKLRLAPVFYTLVQFKFNPIAQMAEYVPKIQDQLRHMGYPDYRLETQMLINIRRPEAPQPEIQNLQQQRWSFTNSKGTEGYLLFNDTLVFHTTDYDSFKSFSKKAIDGLILIHKAVELSYIDRIGLRYLDSISPKQDEDISEYLTPSLAGLSSKIDGSISHVFSETSMQVDNGRLIARAIITENGLAMPPDLVPLTLTLPERLSALSNINAVLDIDYFIMQRFDGVDVSLINTQLEASHEILTKAFIASVTEHALKAWG